MVLHKGIMYHVIYLLISLVLLHGIPRVQMSYHYGPYLFMYNEDETACLTVGMTLTSNLENCSVLSIKIHVDISDTVTFFFIENFEDLQIDGYTSFALVDPSDSSYTNLRDTLLQENPVCLTDGHTLYDQPNGCVNTSFSYSENWDAPAIWKMVMTCGDLNNCTSCALSNHDRYIINECTECQAGTGMTDDRMHCYSCQFPTTSTMEYVGSERNAVENAFMVSNTKSGCEACGGLMDNCLECTAHNVCLACASGLGINETGNGCIVCSDAIDDCLECDTYDRCTDCSGEKVPMEDSKGCQTCGEAMPNCTECETHDICTSCKGDKILREDRNGCQTCSDAMSGCTTCVLFNNCTACDDSSILKDDHTGCAACLEGKTPDGNTCIAGNATRKGVHMLLIWMMMVMTISLM